jgi:acetyl-CoA carboxylase biotin carboxylase subunit
VAMKRALDEFRIGPIKTTIPIHQKILAHTDFVNGKVDTGFIERTFGGPGRPGTT